MRFQTFNRSCSYAGLANMLDDFGFDVDDRDIISQGMIPYLIQYNKQTATYNAGPMLQGKAWFDLYLNQFGLEFMETSGSRDFAIEKLSSLNRKTLIGIKRPATGKHAMVYLGIDGSKYVFQNIKYKDSLEPDFINLSKIDLFQLLDEINTMGWIEKIDGIPTVNLREILRDNIRTFDIYRTEIMNLVEKRQTVFELEDSKARVFTALFLDFYSMMDIIGEVDIRDKLGEVRKHYINATMLKQDLALKDYLDVSLLDYLLANIKLVIKRKISSFPVTSG